jgi:type I restriction enzyme, S subunit
MTTSTARATEMLLSKILEGGLFIDGDWVESKDQDPNGEVRLIQLADVGDGTFRDRSSRFLTLEKAKELRCTFLEPGDVLVARMPEPLGRACIFPGVGQPAVTVVDVCVLRPIPDRARSEWLVKAINAPRFRASMQAFVRGTTRQRISRKNLGSLRLDLPSVEQQSREADFVQRFEVARGSANSHVIAGRRAVDRFCQSVLAAACSGRLTADWPGRAKGESAAEAIQRKRLVDRERLGKKYRQPFMPDRDVLPDIPHDWCWVALPELGEMGRGKSKHRPRNDPKLYGNQYPFVQTGDVARSGGRVTSHTQFYSEAGLAQSRLWPARTVCITIAANIADSALLTYPACFPDSVVGIIADESVALPEYLELFVRTARRDLAAFAPATAQANINLAILSEVAVALPSITEQQEIVRRVAELYALADQVSRRIEAASTRVALSTQALLTKIFRDDLVEAGV